VTQLIAKAMFDRHAGDDGAIDGAELRNLMRELAQDLSDEEHAEVMARLCLGVGEGMGVGEGSANTLALAVALDLALTLTRRWRGSTPTATAA